MMSLELCGDLTMKNLEVGTRSPSSAHRWWWTVVILVLATLFALFAAGVGCRLLDRNRDWPQAEVPQPVTEPDSHAP